MFVEAEEVSELERELRSFKQLLENAIKSENNMSTELANAQRDLSTASKQCQLLTAENDQLSTVFHEKLTLISSFVAEFQKNLQDAFNFQKSKQELFRSLKDLSEKNLRYERELRKLQSAFIEKEEEAAILKAALEKAENSLTREIEDVQRQFIEFVQNSIEKDLRKKVEALEKTLSEKQAELVEVAQKLRQKSVELDLLRVDYKVLLNPKVETNRITSESPSRTNKRNCSIEQNCSPQQQLLDRLQRNEKNKKRRTSKKKQKGDTFYDYF